jgi:hypothetical protein
LNTQADLENQFDQAAGNEQKEAFDGKAFMEELKSLRSELRETKEDAKYWREEASRGRTAPQQQTEEEDDPAEGADIDIDADLVEMVTSGDKAGFARAIKEVAKKSGFVSAKEAQKMIRETAGQYAAQQNLLQRYPEMADKNSDFFKAADKHYRRLTAKLGVDGIGVIEEAAEIAARELDYEPEEPVTRRSRRHQEEDDYDEETRRPSRSQREEDDRVSRVSRQQGSRGRRDSEGESQHMNSFQQSLVAKLQSIGAPITKEGYIQRATQDGGQVSGVPTRRNR